MSTIAAFFWTRKQQFQFVWRKCEFATPNIASTSDSGNYFMTSEEFRKHGHDLIDWIATYMDEVEQYPVQSQVAPGDIRKKLPSSPPEEGESFGTIMDDVASVIMPGITHWQSPSFFAYFPSNASPPAILGELLSAGLGVQGMLWSTSPACTELETHVLDWVAELLGLPKAFQSSSSGGGVIQDTASNASLSALLAARERVTEFESNKNGIAFAHRNGPLVAYVSSQAHSSIEKAMKIAGLGATNLRMVDVDDTFALKPELLRSLVTRDIEEGRRPFFVCATIGTTSSGAVDPIRKVGELARDFGLWMHVDAAYAGSASVCPEFRVHQDGLEYADSYTFNPHKWLLTNFDCNLFYVADRSALINTFSILPEYLRNTATESGAVLDYRDWHVQLGRRFRSLKLWFVIRSYGAEGLRAYIRSHVALANEFAEWVDDDPDWNVVAPVNHSLVCFRHTGGDAVNEQIMKRVNDSGKLFLTHTKLNGQFTLRLAIGSRTTGHEHLVAAWDALKDAGQA